MGFLTEEEIDSLRVKRMILHVVGKKDSPFLPEAETKVQSETFFRSRILAEAASGVHSFTEHSQVRPLLQDMATGALAFEAGGQELSRLFWRDHVKQATTGAFFVFELRGDDADAVLYALIKYDYREAVELRQENGENVLRDIIQAFVKEKRAIQKICVARVRKGKAETMVSAADRMKEAPDLTDYFERYLGVSRSRSTWELSQKLNEVLRTALEAMKEHLPDKDVGAAVARAKLALQPRGKVTNDDIVDAILHAANRPDDEKLRDQFERTTRRRLRAGDLDELEFLPDPRALALRPRRVIKTVEDVKLEFPDEELGRSVHRTTTDAGVVFTVTSASPLIQDSTLPPRVVLPTAAA